MITILSTFVPAPSFGLRSRACLELELIALRHQVSLLRCQHKGHDEDIEQIEANGRNNVGRVMASAIALPSALARQAETRGENPGFE